MQKRDRVDSFLQLPLGHQRLVLVRRIHTRLRSHLAFAYRGHFPFRDRIPVFHRRTRMAPCLVVHRVPALVGYLNRVASLSHPDSLSCPARRSEES